VQITIYPSYVQGEKAAQDIVRGIQALDRLGLDVIIIGRGGGSIEDLWAFNEEIVAEAVYHAATPIISAVGHETDTVITDYVADLRASTPSQGAELAVFDYQVFQSTLLGMEDELNRRMHFRLRLLAEKSASLEAQLRHLSPAATVTTQRMHAARLEEALRDAMNRQLSSLSGGQLQRVMLARVIAQETPVILLDEPTNHLDIKYHVELMSYLKTWSEGHTETPESTYRNTVISVFHDIGTAASVSDNMILMKDGKLIKTGVTGKVLTKDSLNEIYDIDVLSHYSKIYERLRLIE
jgi:exodeoxyribonuclease VII large subunit